MVKLLCETDFVAKTEDFQNLAKELSMQVTSMKPENVQALLGQDYMRDPQMTIEELVKRTAAKLGENVKLAAFERMEL
jgi:elongation factor Ts